MCVCVCVQQHFLTDDFRCISDALTWRIGADGEQPPSGSTHIQRIRQPVRRIEKEKDKALRVVRFSAIFLSFHFLIFQFGSYGEKMGWRKKERKWRASEQQYPLLSFLQFFCLDVTDRLYSNSREIYTRVLLKKSHWLHSESGRLCVCVCVYWAGTRQQHKCFPATPWK